MDQQDFLRYVLGDSQGYLEVVTATEGREYLPYPLTAPVTTADARFRSVVVPRPGYDLRDNGITTLAVPVDIDPKAALSVPPSIKEAAGEHAQGVYRLAEPISIRDIPAYHRKLDPLGQLPAYLPFPGTETTKWGEPLPVEVERQPSYRVWTTQEVRRIEPYLAAPEVSEADLGWEPTEEERGTGVQFYLASRLGPGLATRIGHWVAAPSPALDKIVAALLEQQFSLREIIWVAAQSEHPFRHLGYDVRWELARWIARQAATVQAPASQAISRIRQLRAVSGKSSDKMEAISDYIIKDMRQRGVFLHQTNNTYWYVDAETGEPIELSKGSERMHILISHRYGVNRATQEHNHAADQIVVEAGILPKTTIEAKLSYYRPGSGGGAGSDNGSLYVHFGGRDVGVLTADGLSPIRNGEAGLVFHLPGEADPVVTTDLRTDADPTWWDQFLPASYFRSLVGMDPQIASALIRVWAQFVLFREDAPTRPLVAALGPPGSGKSTFGRRLYALFYGGRKELMGLDGPAQFDTATSNSPFVIFDNLDRCPSWLPARLEMSITPRDMERRKLFTDNTVYLVHCDAIVGITAHDSSIFREGIFDRMMVLHFRRLTDDEKIPESRLDRQVTDHREEFLSGLLSDARRILQTPRPPDPTAGWDNKLRIMDFVDMGAWFAGALGILPEFKEAVSRIKVRQTSLILEGESALVDAVESYAAARPGPAGEWHNASQLLSALTDHATDAEMFGNLYKTPAVLATKLAAIYTQLRPITGLEMKEDPRNARRSWRIVPIKETND